ncbi:DUF6278 family protein [Kitasatospora sp. NPDC048540]|uniref:DUF6278 family protein n=1 Tax=unclassified Kitasatospora TaxID=2633591 RepID=UPI00053B8368|nr:DUF6278 family protein [Kitasatospora sp. MBT63]
MGFGFFDHWRARGEQRAEPGGGAGEDRRQEAMAELFAECGLLRELAGSAGVRLDDSAQSLSALDQLLPRWRDDPEVSDWLGNDAGLYLGTVIRRTLPAAEWRLGEHGRPLLVLPTGLELDVTALGHGWADQGTPELSAVYLAATDG